MGSNASMTIFENFIKNCLAYAIPVVILQFYLFPGVAHVLGEEANGLFLTVLSLNYFLTNISAGVLSQTKLLRNKAYEELGISGDFNFLLVAMALINAVAVTIGLFILMGSSVTVSEIILSIIVSLLFMVHDYITIQYRIKLDFSKILISNLILCIGYFIGLYCFKNYVGRWQIIFICAYGLNEIYDIHSTTILKESYHRTTLFSPTFKKYLTLLGASLITYLISYGDRLLLYPFTSGSDVSVLNSAEIVGKMLMILSTPLSTFILSYLVRIEKFTFAFSPKRVIAFILFCVLSYGLCIIISYPILGFLYPLWAERSLKLVPITTLVSLINLISILFNVLMVRYCHAKWQIIVNLYYFFAYIIFSFGLLSIYGLKGFCLGNLVAAIVRLSAIAIIFKKKYLNLI